MLKDCTKHRWNIFYYDLRAVVRYQQQVFNSLTINIESSVLWCPLQFPHWRQCSVRLYLPLFVGGLVSYLRYLCLFGSSLPPVVCRRARVLFTKNHRKSHNQYLVICVCLRRVMLNTYCIVLFVLFFFALSTKGCQFSVLSILYCPFCIIWCLFQTN